MNLVLAAIAVIGVSLSGPLMAATAAPVLAIAFWRNAMATGLLAPFALTRHRAAITGQNRHGWLLAFVAGAALAAHFACWVASLKLTSVAAATALVSMQVLFVIAIDALRGHRAAPAVVGGALLAVLGVVAISGVDLSISREAILGDALALAGGLFAAVYVIVGSRVRETLSTTAYTFTCYGICSAILLVACLAAGVPLGGWSARAWMLIVAVMVCAQLLGHSVINHLLAVMSPVVVSLMLLLEVPGAALLAAAFLGEALPWATYAGIVLILAGLAVVTAANGRARPAETLVAD
ncbi:DMT family transporter [Aeromicrobium duanguangcaii]|uniref:DMT family transporter n=1 Tax=Aeromicrobium duanguangcaii TaxID=2968086 RepID=A0ABY5KCX2_9ACTN|nr:DMT family transporter [Aeromicrobium duanguangcaii]MCD9154713.1 DMT family transporter [Aeromicrobium duanguangcaii]UUI67873.1 DMT family transporter [Aeromicrobium duanguangcaii]